MSPRLGKCETVTDDVSGLLFEPLSLAYAKVNRLASQRKVLDIYSRKETFRGVGVLMPLWRLILLIQPKHIVIGIILHANQLEVFEQLRW